MDAFHAHIENIKQKTLKRKTTTKYDSRSRVQLNVLANEAVRESRRTASSRSAEASDTPARIRVTRSKSCRDGRWMYLAAVLDNAKV
jgi:hypothetical protein